jgi:predicted nucleotidyltransferase
MKKLAAIEKKIKANKQLLNQQYKVRRIGIFGSYALGRQTRKSDLDIVVEFKETPDIFKFLRLEEYLKSMLGIRVDLTTPKALKALIKPEILRQTIYI